MTELERQILHALDRNQHRGGLTGSEIRKVLGLRVVDHSKMRTAVVRLIKKNLIQCQNYPTKNMKIYSLLEVEGTAIELIEFQNLPLHYVVAKAKIQSIDREFDTGINHPLFDESKLLRILEDALNGWINVSSPNDFSFNSGLYAFYSGNSKTCLHIGQTLNIRSRGLSHPVWKQAIQEFDKPSAAYKIIEYEDLNETRRELVYEECLLIGLLRPKWNVITPHHYCRE